MEALFYDYETEILWCVCHTYGNTAGMHPDVRAGRCDIGYASLFPEIGMPTALLLALPLADDEGSRGLVQLRSGAGPPGGAGRSLRVEPDGLCYP